MSAEKIYLSWQDVFELARDAYQSLCENVVFPRDRTVLLYPVPRGGFFAAQALQNAAGRKACDMHIVDDPKHAHLIVDDLVDSGRTLEAHAQHQLPFVSLLDKRNPLWKGKWVVFPWERDSQGQEVTVEDNIVRILEHIGEDPHRDGLLETPKRVVKSYRELFSGYRKDPADLFKTFDVAADEMVILRDIEFQSTCEHHMLPFTGKAHIAYIPNGKVIGISKLARLLEVFSRRLQVQERLTSQITDTLMTHLQPKGAACMIEAAHSCMTCRGVGKQHSKMITSSLQGAFREAKVRAEFMALITR